MGALDTFLSDTIGVVWRAASGTVDPWTKQELIDQQAAAQVEASGGSTSYNDAAAAAASDVTQSLQSSSVGNADPSNFTAGLNNSLNSLGNKLNVGSKDLLYIGLGVAALVVGLYLLEFKAARKAAGA